MRTLLALICSGLFVVAAEPTPPPNDTAWLQTKGTLLFHDAFERDETGNGLKGIGNGWESATADRLRVPANPCPFARGHHHGPAQSTFQPTAQIAV